MFLLKDDYWEMRRTQKKGRGVFTKKAIQKGTIVGDYLGKVIKTAEYDLEQDRQGLYLMYLTDEASVYPDLTKPGIHVFNHSCVPNCWMYAYRGHTLFFAIRNIEPLEELTISYLLSPKTEGCNPCTHVCRCDSKNCTGTMHLSEEKYEKWQEFQDIQKGKTKRVKFTFGKTLQRLRTYPKRIPISSVYKEMCSIK